MRKWKNLDTVTVTPIKEKPEYAYCIQCGSDKMSLIYLTPVTVRPVCYDYLHRELINIPDMKIKPELTNK